jgi:hypothetical protein
LDEGETVEAINHSDMVRALASEWGDDRGRDRRRHAPDAHGDRRRGGSGCSTIKQVIRKPRHGRARGDGHQFYRGLRQGLGITRDDCLAQHRSWASGTGMKY